MLLTDLLCRRFPRGRVHHLRNESPLVPRSRPGKANWPHGGSFPKVIEHLFFKFLNNRLKPKAIQYSSKTKNGKNFGMTKAMLIFISNSGLPSALSASTVLPEPSSDTTRSASCLWTSSMKRSTSSCGSGYSSSLPSQSSALPTTSFSWWHLQSQRCKSSPGTVNSQKVEFSVQTRAVEPQPFLRFIIFPFSNQ